MAPAIAVSASLTSLSMPPGTSRLSLKASLTSLSLANNDLGDDGAEALSIGLKESKSLKSLDLSGKGYGDGLIGPRGATALASVIAVSASLTSVR